MQWIDWAATYGVGFLQLLPINEMGADFSPYNAISSVALEPLYLALSPELIPGLSASAVTEAAASLENRHIGNQQDRRVGVDYPAVRQTKQRLLLAAYAQWPTSGSAAQHAAYEAFLAEQQDWLPDYTLYRLLMAEHRNDERWDQWPAAVQQAQGARDWFEAESQHRPTLAQEREFFAWVQWLCFQQWQEVRAHGDRCGVELMGDVPIGVSYHSVDVMFQPEGFNLDWSGGAPRETMFKHDRFIQRWGQNWGVPLYRWEQMAENNYTWWRRRVGKLTQIFQRFRIDHVLGFYRIYAFPWQPKHNDDFLDFDETAAAQRCNGRLPQWAWRDDLTAENRAANRADGDERLRMILDAAGTATVVAEDLGCVPDYVRPHLESLDIAGFRIPHWDSDGGHVVAGGRFPTCSFATYATHDHDTLAAMWQDLHTTLHNPAADEEAQQGAAWNLQLLCEFAGIAHTPPDDFPAYTPEVQWALIDALMACRSRDAALMVTDLFAMTQRFNRPGTVGDDNWRLRLPFTAEELATTPHLRIPCERLRDCLLKHHRSTLPEPAPDGGA